MNMRVFILEDETLAAQRLMEFVAKFAPAAEIAGWERSVKGGLAWLQQNRSPDLLFSDIELLDGNVFRLYEQYKIECPVIFTTAYDQFLLQAFQTNGIAYLLKPYDYEQFDLAMQKYRLLFGSSDSPVLSDAVIARLQQAFRPAFEQYKQRFAIRMGGGIYLLETDEIQYFGAEDKLVLAYTADGKRHPINQSIADVESLLDPRYFFRINRAEIVHVKAIKKIEPHFNDRLAVTLHHFPSFLITSASRTSEFRKWLEAF